MATNYSPKIVTNNLIQKWDMNNPKMFNGPAIQNLVTNRTFYNTSGTGISIIGGTETVNIPQLGPTDVAFSNIQNNYTFFSPNNNDCCPSPIGNYGNFSVTPSTLYTYAIVYKSEPGYTHPNFMYRYEYNGVYVTYITEGGVHNNNNRIDLGDGWYWAWGTFTTNVSTNYIGYAGSFWYRYSQTSEKFSVARVLITPGNYTGLHPRYWPANNTTRTTSQVIADLRGITTTVIDPVYTTNGTFTFDGLKSRIHLASSADRFSWTPSGSGLNTATFEMWVKTSDTGGGLIFSKPWNGNGEYNYLLSHNQIILQIGAQSFGPSLPSTLATGQWTHIAVVLTPTQVGVYRNGELFYPFTNHNITNNTPSSGNFSIPLCLMSLYPYGEGWAGNTGFSILGEMALFRAYSAQLTAAEIRQNFNAHRGRFGV
jgi:hypothetical protein